MDLVITAVGLDTGTAGDLHISAAPSAPAGDVLAGIRAGVGAAAAAPMWVAGRPLVEDGDAADCGLADGAVVLVGTPAPVVTSQGLAEVVVASGPDCGQHMPLRAGHAVV